MRPVFPYDSALAAAVRAPAHSIADVIRTLRTVDAICVDDDGLKWFNWLYLQVTEAVASDAETAAYVEELERRVDLMEAAEELPSGESLAAELTRFLRERDEQDEQDQGAEGPAS